MATRSGVSRLSERGASFGRPHTQLCEEPMERGVRVQFTPPVGAWRVRATFFGTRRSSPSASHLVYVDATTAG